VGGRSGPSTPPGKAACTLRAAMEWRTPAQPGLQDGEAGLGTSDAHTDRPMPEANAIAPPGAMTAWRNTGPPRHRITRCARGHAARSAADQPSHDISSKRRQPAAYTNDEIYFSPLQNADVCHDTPQYDWRVFVDSRPIDAIQSPDNPVAQGRTNAIAAYGILP